MNDELALIDSNLLSYVFDRSEPEKRRICKELVADCWKGKLKYAVSVQNLSEFYVVVTRKIEHPIPEAVAKRFIHYWDALIAATMKENKIFCIYTENGDFKSIPWLKVINPSEVTTD